MSVKLEGLYRKLKEYYADPTKYAAEIAKLNSEIAELETELKIHEQKKQDPATGTTLTYSPATGTFETPDQQQEREAATKAGKKSEQYQDWQRKFQKEPITHNEWYNTEQVKFLTGQDVPAGNKELGEFLAKNAGKLPLTFAYLMVPDANNPSLNHFVTINISAKNEVTYLDSNGALIRPEDRATIASKLPGASFHYRDHNGEKITEEQAQSNPTSVLRVQFDGHNCGMYSSELTNLFDAAKGNEQNIQTSIRNIKQLSPDAQRQEHSARLQNGISKEVAAIKDVMQSMQTDLPEAKKPSHVEGIQHSSSTQIRR